MFRENTKSYVKTQKVRYVKTRKITWKNKKVTETTSSKSYGKSQKVTLKQEKLRENFQIYIKGKIQCLKFFQSQSIESGSSLDLDPKILKLICRNLLKILEKLLQNYAK